MPAEMRPILPTALRCSRPASPMRRPMARPAGVPTYGPNIYSQNAIVDPYPYYAALRELGAVVWLPRQRVFALPRYAECKTVLRDDVAFLSGHGVGLNPLVKR